ncbi:hypothetical protein RvY_09200-2 [Ramazzottius varieornatus]|uniref:Rhodanese domain-containing protein n=1 Tax=Ramazzottius varieornatus TaxID=947166 RepID=A0A1D1VGG4_RAMVA|nr:hypothetical protein RvY_09200-2 [Ramazzottius varieornatus]
MKLKSMATPTKIYLMDPPELATLLETSVNKVLLLDSRSCFEHNNGKIRRSLHIVSSSMIKRRLQTDKVKILELLHLSADSVKDIRHVVVYDQSSSDLSSLCPDSFTTLVLSKLANHFPSSVHLLKGGFAKFLTLYPEECVQSSEAKPAPCPSVEPGELIRACGPTQIFPHVYLGSEKDALSLDTIKARKISHVLNVSMTCPKADFIQEANFMRIAVNDTCTDKLLCHFIKAFKFLGTCTALTVCT